MTITLTEMLARRRGTLLAELQRTETGGRQFPSEKLP